uniref:Uncharacterized protein n=1 Tax=Caenorhabditis japonica TaxID=281687 RepID=A0A8R1DRK8_CAEJA
MRSSPSSPTGSETIVSTSSPPAIASESSATVAPTTPVFRPNFPPIFNHMMYSRPFMRMPILPQHFPFGVPTSTIPDFASAASLAAPPAAFFPPTTIFPQTAPLDCSQILKSGEEADEENRKNETF